MPDVLIEVRGNWIGNRKTQMIEAVHLALVEAIRIPLDDKVLRFVSHASDDFVIPPHRGEKFTRIVITMFAGRSLDANASSIASSFAGLNRLEFRRQT
jgi:hypothetical protein